MSKTVFTQEQEKRIVEIVADALRKVLMYDTPRRSGHNWVTTPDKIGNLEKDLEEIKRAGTR